MGIKRSSGVVAATSEFRHRPIAIPTLHCNAGITGLCFAIFWLFRCSIDVYLGAYGVLSQGIFWSNLNSHCLLAQHKNHGGEFKASNDTKDTPNIVQSEILEIEGVPDHSMLDPETWLICLLYMSWYMVRTFDVSHQLSRCDNLRNMGMSPFRTRTGLVEQARWAGSCGRLNKPRQDNHLPFSTFPHTYTHSLLTNSLIFLCRCQFGLYM